MVVLCVDRDRRAEEDALRAEIEVAQTELEELRKRMHMAEGDEYQCFPNRNLRRSFQLSLRLIFSSPVLGTLVCVGFQLLKESTSRKKTRFNPKCATWSNS